MMTHATGLSVVMSGGDCGAIPSMSTGEEDHQLGNVGWLRAAVLGANDGIVSTSSLIIGVAASDAGHHAIIVSGIAGLVAGAMSMATGEYVSVQSQADTEKAAIRTERAKLQKDPRKEQAELARIYVGRGVDAKLADRVAAQLMAHDALGAHARDDLGITEALSAKPLQAAIASAISFSAGALLPLIVVVLSPENHVIGAVAVASLFLLAALGGLAAKVGRASVMRGIMRVTLWSALAMAVTAGIGALFGTAL